MTGNKRTKHRRREWVWLFSHGVTFEAERCGDCWTIFDMRGHRVGKAASLEEARKVVEQIDSITEDQTCLTSAR